MTARQRKRASKTHDIMVKIAGEPLTGLKVLASNIDTGRGG